MNELYENIIRSICEVCDMDKNTILLSNKEEAVDARYILIYMLSIKLTDLEISKTTGLSKSLANKVRNTFSERRKKYSLRLKLKDIENKVGIKQVE